jgi:hypothetical protein
VVFLVVVDQSHAGAGLLGPVNGHASGRGMFGGATDRDVIERPTVPAGRVCLTRFLIEAAVDRCRIFASSANKRGAAR